ncbi:unnamed protein product [Mortierella alpina]
MLAALSSNSHQSARRLVTLAQSMPKTTSATALPFLSSTSTSHTATAQSRLVKRMYHHHHQSSAIVSPTSSYVPKTTPSLPLRSHLAFSNHVSSMKHAQARTRLVSRAYTSSSSSSSSPSSVAGTTARLLAEETSSQAASATATAAAKAPLTLHEEMTKVRFSFNWWKEWTIIMGVFAVTGSSTVMFVKPILKDVFKLEGSMKEGPWSFRIAYLSTTLPLYSCVLLTVASIAGRRPYFKKVVLRMWGRFLPKKALQRFQ